MSTTEREALIQEIAADAVQTLADSSPDDDTIEAQELLRGTPYESMFVVHGDAIRRAVAVAADAALDAIYPRGETDARASTEGGANAG